MIRPGQTTRSGSQIPTPPDRHLSVWIRRLMPAGVLVVVAACGSGELLPPPSAPSDSQPASSTMPSVDDPTRALLRARPSVLDGIDVASGCPVSQPKHVMGTVLSALGSEPLYAVGLGAVSEWEQAREIDGERYLEVTWVSEPTNSSPLLVWGVELETREPVRFRLPNGDESDELYLTTETSVESESIGPGYRSWPILIGAPEPGCYGLQVEAIGHIGGYAIVFELK